VIPEIKQLSTGLDEYFLVSLTLVILNLFDDFLDERRDNVI
jgi:hypothetical protein